MVDLFSTLIKPFYSPLHFNYSKARFWPGLFSISPLQNPFRKGLDKGSKWGLGPLNTPISNHHPQHTRILKMWYIFICSGQKNAVIYSGPIMYCFMYVLATLDLGELDVTSILQQGASCKAVMMLPAEKNTKRDGNLLTLISFGFSSVNKREGLL